MDAISMIKERRSIRKFTNEKVDRNIINDIIATCIYAPTWANSQTIRYTVVDNKEKLKTLANECFDGFQHNLSITADAAGAIVISNVKGKCGCAPDGSYMTSKGSAWEMFDSGVASQTFCLCAHEKGIGTVIMGIFDENKIAEVINLPENETIAAVIPYGYKAEDPNPPKRKTVEEITRYL